MRRSHLLLIGVLLALVLGGALVYSLRRRNTSPMRVAQPAPAATRPASTLPPEPAPIARVQTLRLIVEEEYDNAPKAHLPVWTLADATLSPVHVRLLPADAANYDATLRVQAKGHALSARYARPEGARDVPAGLHYSGGRVAGRIALELPGHPVFEKSFSGEAKPPSMIKRSYSEPSSDSFSAALAQPGSFLPAFLELIGTTFGPQPLVAAALNDSSGMIAIRLDDALHQEAAVAIGRLNSPAAIRDLATALGDFPRGRYAAEALGNTRSPLAVDPLAGVLTDPRFADKYGLQLAAIRALGETGQPAALPTLLRALEDERGGVRDNAAFALGKLKDTAAVEPLIAALADPEPNVRLSAAEALGNIGDERAVAPLIDFIAELHQDGAPVPRQPVVALKKLTGKDFGPEADAWRAWWAKESRSRPGSR